MLEFGLLPTSGNLTFEIWTFFDNNNNNLDRKITDRSGDDREGSFLFQRISVLLHRFNLVLLQDSFVSVDCPD